MSPVPSGLEVRPTDDNGNTVSPSAATVAIVHRVAERRYEIIGTGFFLTRYGLFVTAAHVMLAMRQSDGTFAECYVLYDGPRNAEGAATFHLRPIKVAYMNDATDACVAQAEFPWAENPQCQFTLRWPSPGEVLATFSYPANVDGWNLDAPETLRVECDYYVGNAIAVIDDSEADRRRAASEYFQQWLTRPFLETTLAIRGGASGSPVFDSAGRVVGLYSSGLGFEPLSYIVLTAHILSLTVDLPKLPSHILEATITRQRPGPYQVVALGHAGHFRLG